MKKLLELPFLGSAFRFLLFLLLVMLSYLCQESVIPYLRIGGIAPNLLLITISVIAVGFGRLRSAWAGAIFGILLEIMTPTVKLLNLAFYCAASIIAGLIFSDRTQQQLDYRRSQGRPAYNLNPLLRTLLCCLLLSFLYHGVNLLKIYLSGYQLLSSHFSRAFAGILFTEALCLLLMIPMRRMVGLHYERVHREKPLKYEKA